MTLDPPTFADVRAAAERLHGVAHTTPVMTSRSLDAIAKSRVFLKCENFQRVGAFKFRGAYNAIAQLSPEERRRGVVAFSSGNHAQGVALAGSLLGVATTIVMPIDAPTIKRVATESYGASLRLYDPARESRETIARQLAEERGLVIIPPFDDARVIAGQGTTALELLDAVPDLDALIAPIGGGGLLAGCAIAAATLRPGIAIYGAEPVGADDTARSFAAGRRVRIPAAVTIADGLRATAPGELTFPILRRLLTDVLTVSDEQIMAAMRLLALRLKLVVEPSGAVAVAAALSGRLPTGRRVGVIVSGGNVDPAEFARVLTSA
ncbi:MAG: pyridoxal-phosphate dependent enzyme [Dehalococcoidia bacterium]|nr:pyridoxal-phosphate dependent enzyme [Dehalococcoidia bacterium]